ncbi:MAG: alpha/beta hydrolase, partial [Paracoccaceae bacterium]
MVGTKMGDRRIFDGAHLRADLYGAGGNGLFVSFDHWRGPARAGFPRTAPVQTALDLGYASLVISTAADDWFLNADLPDLRLALSGFSARYPVVRGIGFSMGGYGALLLSRVLGMSFATLW